MPRGIPKSKTVTAIEPAPAQDAARDADAAPQGPVVARKVFIHAFSSGPRASLEAVPLHEIPLMKRKLEVFGELLTLSEDWPDFVPHEREVTALGLREEHTRLREKYTFKGNDGQQYDLVQDVYGPAHQGRLVAVMRRQAKAWGEAVRAAGTESLPIDVLKELVQLADPEADFIEPEQIEA